MGRTASYCVEPCRTVSTCVELCRTVSNRVELCRTVSNRVEPCRTVSNRVEPCRTVSLQARDKQKHGLMRTVSGSTRPDSVGKLATRLITLINSLPADSEASQLSTLLASLTSSLNQQGAQVTAAAAAFAACIASSAACFSAASLAASSFAAPQLLALRYCLAQPLLLCVPLPQRLPWPCVLRCDSGCTKSNCTQLTHCMKCTATERPCSTPFHCTPTLIGYNRFLVVSTSNPPSTSPTQ